MTVALSVLTFVLLVAALLDAIMIDRSRVRYIDKFFWIVIVILVPLIGALLWFVVGREYVKPATRGSFGPPPSPSPVQRSTMLSDTEAQLAALEQEIAEDKIRALEAELRSKREAPSSDGHNSWKKDQEPGKNGSNLPDEGTPA